jgi:hypothetical protein
VVGQEGIQRIEQSWDRRSVAGKFVYTIRPDSQILLDANQRVDRLMKFLNLTGKSGFVNPEPIIAEIAALSGIDPALVMTKPQPAPPEQPNFSYRFSGAEDLRDPISMAMLIKSGQAPGPEEMAAAKRLIADSLAPLPMPQVTSEAVPQAALPPPAENWGPMERVTKRVEELGG